MELRIQNEYLGPLVDWLNSLSLDGRRSRYRTQFCRKVTQIANEVEQERKDIAESHAEKDEAGKAKIVTDNKTNISSYVIPDEKMKEFNAEYQELLDKVAVFEVKPADEQMFYTVKDIVLNTDEKIQGRIAANYDNWCQSFEKLV